MEWGFSCVFACADVYSVSCTKFQDFVFFISFNEKEIFEIGSEMWYKHKL